ncbi:cytochrome c peroxidase [Sphingobacterium oryzagri]|uniref:Cytochrome c peroxidase n=1 Tax=Sphingobacterium oryzagri TaxID=3025669 RepID=A0ABY7WHE8_9SPHI|nr:cytochrome c peroxidase [Sphingobacterium sp. KACC 22765]WDF66824.1 cytochrome c peroxidase [Sphingobacterium sp. KACC 22765]
MLKFAFLVILIVVMALSQLSGLTKMQQPAVFELAYPSYFGKGFSIPKDNPMTRQGVELGRMLFYERALSFDNSMSCATCHQQAFAFTDGEKFSKGVTGKAQQRNTMALVNLLWVKDFFWDGRVRGLEQQVEVPLTSAHEMGQSWAKTVEKLTAMPLYRRQFKAAFGDAGIDQHRIAKALAQFERTLISSDSKYDRYLRGAYQPTATELNGITLFYGSGQPGARGGFCAHCHGGPKTYQELYMNNGLDSVFKDSGRFAWTGKDYDRGRFRVVSLRNIALTAPYMHDGRFASLEEVVDHYSDQVVQTAFLSPFLLDVGGKQIRLTTKEKKEIVSFLHMLTDSSFISNPQFGDPFTTKQKI